MGIDVSAITKNYVECGHHYGPTLDHSVLATGYTATLRRFLYKDCFLLEGTKSSPELS